MMEGGDEAMMDMAAGAGMETQKLENPHKYESDARSYDGWAQVPAAFLKQMIVNPYWGDLIKAEAIAWEFNPEKGPKNTDFTEAAGLVGTAVCKASTEGHNVWFSGYVGTED